VTLAFDLDDSKFVSIVLLEIGGAWFKRFRLMWKDVAKYQ